MSVVGRGSSMRDCWRVQNSVGATYLETVKSVCT
jgi:hypothetical protein